MLFNTVTNKAYRVVCATQDAEKQASQADYWKKMINSSEQEDRNYSDTKPGRKQLRNPVNKDQEMRTIPDVINLESKIIAVKESICKFTRKLQKRSILNCQREASQIGTDGEEQDISSEDNEEENILSTDIAQTDFEEVCIFQ